MSQADELLNSLSNDEITEYSADPITESHVVINNDRSIYVPEELRSIAVQFDHNIETVTFDCPRYWDDHDFSTMKIYINYKRPDNTLGSYIAKNIVIDSDDQNIIHFEWTIDRHVTEFKGTLSFLVCIKKTDTDGNEENHWNSELCSNMSISEGLECEDSIINNYPSIVTDLLTRMEFVETFPPTVTVSEIERGHRVTVTDTQKTKMFDIMDGITYTPTVSADGDLSWSNNGGIDNPDIVNIKGEKGEKGDAGGLLEVNSGKIMTVFVGTQEEFDAYAGDKSNMMFLPEDDQTIENLEVRISTAESEIETNKNNISNLNTDLTILSDTVDGIYNDIYGDGDIGGLSQEVSSLETRLGTAETNIGTNTDNISNLETRLGTAESEIETLASQISESMTMYNHDVYIKVNNLPSTGIDIDGTPNLTAEIALSFQSTKQQLQTYGEFIYEYRSYIGNSDQRHKANGRIYDSNGMTGLWYIISFATILDKYLAIVGSNTNGEVMITLESSNFNVVKFMCNSTKISG